MSSARQLLIWMVAATAACALLAGLLAWEQSTRIRESSFLVGSPRVGAHLFEKKGCLNCHAVNGWGGRLAPDLGFEAPARASRSQLVAAM